MTFRAKIDSLFVKIISAVVIVISTVFLLPVILEDEMKASELFIVLSLMVLTVAFILHSAFSIKYTFHERYLFVKGGFFRSRIPYEEISRVCATNEIFFGYRLLSSKDAIEIFYKTASMGSVKISPKEKELFLMELKKRGSHIKMDFPNMKIVY